MTKTLTLPGPEDRSIVIGRTGSGKTFVGLWLLSKQNITEQPWIVIDYKRDKNIARIPYAQHISVGDLPEFPGVYIVQPLVTKEAYIEMEQYLTDIWEHENIGIYIDEGKMLANSTALEMILIQGRSKNVPVITLTQRPVGISREAFSEAQYVLVFPNHDKRERKTIAEFTPLFNSGSLAEHLLPPYHFYYYDVVSNELVTMKPVPQLDDILRTFEEKLRPPEPEEIREEPAQFRRYMPI